MAYRFPHQVHLKSFRLVDRAKTLTHSLTFNTSRLYDTPKASCLVGYMFTGYTSSGKSCLRALSCIDIPGYSDELNFDTLVNTHDPEMEDNHVNHLLRLLHESATSFSLAFQSLELVKSGPELAMAWMGVDLRAWHKLIANQVAVYTLMRSAVDVLSLLPKDQQSDNYPAFKILYAKTDLLRKHIQSELSKRHLDLIQQFRVELSHTEGYFLPLLKKWITVYTERYINRICPVEIACIIVAVCCCAAVEKFCSERLPILSLVSVDEVLAELLNTTCSLCPMDKLHVLATKAGLEEEFLSSFGTRVLSKNNKDTIFWIGLAHRKLSEAFKGDIIPKFETSLDKVQEHCLATLGLFAYLGRRTRVFFSAMAIKDLDEQVNTFVSYLECGSLAVYPELSCLCNYQTFIDTITDEIGWLDFYATSNASISNQGKIRSKPHVTQAEIEMILTTIFSVCCDAFAGIVHFSKSEQEIEPKLSSFLMESQRLLSMCLEDYSAAYDRPDGLLNVAEKGFLDLEVLLRPQCIAVSCLKVRVSADLLRRTGAAAGRLHALELRMAIGAAEVDTISNMEEICVAESFALRRKLIRKCSLELMNTSSNICISILLLLTDIKMAAKVVIRAMQGHRVTRRERKTLQRTISDVASLVPATILLLLPVILFGRTILATVRKFMPYLIPSVYSSERLGAVKQLMRIQKLEIESWSNVEDISSCNV